MNSHALARIVVTVSSSLALSIGCGGSGSSGSHVACTQKADADGNPDCAGHPGKTRKLDCDATETQSAVSAGCELEKPGGSDVCCPTSVSGTPQGAGGSPTGGGSVPCTQKSDADNNPECTSHPGKPRKLDCDAAVTETAVSAGCEPTTAGASDVCCPTTVSGTP